MTEASQPTSQITSGSAAVTTTAAGVTTAASADTDAGGRGRGVVTMLFVRALEGDEVADRVLGELAFGPPGTPGGDPYALRAYTALASVSVAELDRERSPTPELSVAGADQCDARARDDALIAIALAAARQGHRRTEDPTEDRTEDRTEAGVEPRAHPGR